MQRILVTTVLIVGAIVVAAWLATVLGDAFSSLKIGS